LARQLRRYAESDPDFRSALEQLIAEARDKGALDGTRVVQIANTTVTGQGRVGSIVNVGELHGNLDA
jgi:hypothetical protein